MKLSIGELLICIFLRNNIASKLGKVYVFRVELKIKHYTHFSSELIVGYTAQYSGCTLQKGGLVSTFTYFPV